MEKNNTSKYKKAREIIMILYLILIFLSCILAFAHGCSGSNILIEDVTYSASSKPTENVTYSASSKSWDVSNFANLISDKPTSVSSGYRIFETLRQLIQFALVPLLLTIFILSILEFENTKKKIKSEISDTNEQKEMSYQASSSFNLWIVSTIVLWCTSNIFNAITSFAAKPIIYLYPTNDTKVKVKLGKKEILTCTYPKYEDNWEVLAKPNGDLTDLKTGRNLYSLYWESKNTVPPKFDEGFVVKGEDSATFLEEKLAILGLTQREANEFIIYWLPQLENNAYNFIRFQTIEEINENMPLEISPKPDSLIRIMMEFKPLKKEITVPEQKLCTPTRNGFVAVEWGGTKV